MSHEDTLEIGGRKIKTEEKEENGEGAGRKKYRNKKRKGKENTMKRRNI